MPLPNSGMSFTPLDPLTAAEMNDIVENIEALADGTGPDAEPSRFVPTTELQSVLSTDPANTSDITVDCTSVTSANTYAVTGFIQYTQGATVRSVLIKPGLGSVAVSVIKNPVVSSIGSGAFTIGTDTSQIFYVQASNADITNITVYITGYYETIV